MPVARTAPSNDPAPNELLRYLPAFKVVVCTTCNYAVQPSAIPRHLKDIHKIHRGNRRPFMKYVSALDLQEAEGVVHTPVHEFPVPFLPVHDGLKCGALGCSHLCVSVKRMKSHWISSHGQPGESTAQWRPVPLQTFFRGNLLQYFTKPESRFTEISSPIHLHKPHSEQHEKPFYLNDADELLLKHYVSCSCACKEMITNPDLANVWQVNVPLLARRYSFLMHGILALSAMHLSYLYPARQREYVVQATIHQDIAMPLYREIIFKNNKEDCHAIFAFGHLVAIYSFASEKQDEQLFIVDPTSLEILPNWLYFLRSGCSTLCDVWDDLEVGPLKALIDMWEVPDQELDEEGRPLVDYLLTVIPPEDSDKAWTDEEVQLYREAAVELGTAFSSTVGIGNRFAIWDALRIWPMKISDEYIDMVYKWHPGALILLAHYCILLKKIENHWYFEGRSTRLLSSILKCLDETWHECIRLPLEVIGLSQAIW